MIRLSLVCSCHEELKVTLPVSIGIDHRPSIRAEGRLRLPAAAGAEGCDLPRAHVEQDDGGVGCWALGVGCWVLGRPRTPNTQRPTPNAAASVRGRDGDDPLAAA